MKPIFAQINIEPEVAELLEGVVSRPKISPLATSAENVLFDAAEIDSWKSDSLEYTTASLRKLRDTLQVLYKVKDVATQIAGTAEAYMPAIKSKLMGLGLYSLPTEIFGDILYLSIFEDKVSQCTPLFLKRVLAIQSVCRYFRNVVRDSPEFWAFLSSSTPQLFELQLERSKECGLSLDLLVPHLRHAGVAETLRLHASRCKSLSISLPRLDFHELIHDRISSLTFARLTKVELYYESSHDFPSEDFDALGSIAPRMPKLAHLHMINRVPSSNVRTCLTTFSLVIEEGFIRWSGRHLLAFIASQNSLRSLNLHVHAKPQGTIQEFAEVMEEYSVLGGRSMEVSIMLDKWSSTDALKPIWPALSLIGMKRINVDLTRVDSNWQFRGLCHALDYASGKYAPELKTLAILLAPVVASVPFRTKERDVCDETELASSLQVTRIHNCSHLALCVMRPLLERLLQCQEAPGTSPFAKLVMIGQVQSEADRLAFVQLLGKDRVDWD